MLGAYSTGKRVWQLSIKFGSFKRLYLHFRSKHLMKLKIFATVRSIMNEWHKLRRRPTTQQKMLELIALLAQHWVLARWLCDFKEILYFCDFPVGGGSRLPVPPLDPRMVKYQILCADPVIIVRGRLREFSLLPYLDQISCKRVSPSLIYYYI